PRIASRTGRFLRFRGTPPRVTACTASSLESAARRSHSRVNARDHASHSPGDRIMTNVQQGKYRGRLPQLDGGLFLTDGGLETTLIFHQGVELPLFAAFDLLREQAGRMQLRQYFLPYIAAARAHGAGFVLESATWRASSDWGARLGYSAPALAAVNRDAI